MILDSVFVWTIKDFHLEVNFDTEEIMYHHLPIRAVD